VFWTNATGIVRMLLVMGAVVVGIVTITNLTAGPAVGQLRGRRHHL